MQNTIYQPSKALRPFIEHYRIWQYKKDQIQTVAFKDYPRTAMDMVFCFEGQLQIAIMEQAPITLDTCSFIGHFDKAYYIQPQSNIVLLNVRFKPNGIYPLTKIPLQLFLNSHIALADLMDTSIYQLHEQLQNTPNDSTKIQQLESYFLPIFQKSDLHYKLEYGLQCIHKSHGQITVKALSQQLNTNYKSLDRWFNKKIGLSPKRFIQLTRFKHILQNLEATQQPDWMNLVVEHGFYDQAHFIKEFKQFAGVSPTVYTASTLDFSKQFKK